jgi:SRSO17 transposase
MLHPTAFSTCWVEPTGTPISCVDHLRGYVIEHLGDDESVLIIDKTGSIKKGQKSVGVKRQYTGAAGKTENCQVGVLLAW